jgi:hypothetical protein
MQLETPGAGISTAEMWILNQLVKPLILRNVDLPHAIEHLKITASEIEKNLARLKPEQLVTRVLVKRPWFVEDSSRNWSAALLCRHLAIVDGAMANAIGKGLTLHAASLPAPSERVAAVKPEGERNDLTAITDFRQAVDKLVAAATQHPEAELARRTLPHPWLGDISHLQWIRFAGFHHRVHLAHLKQIVRGLPHKIQVQSQL